MTQRRYTHTCTQTAPAPPGCMFIMLTTVCYSWIKCKIISDLGICASALLLLSLSLLFSSLYLPPLLPPFFRSSPPCLFLSPHLSSAFSFPVTRVYLFDSDCSISVFLLTLSFRVMVYFPGCSLTRLSHVGELALR